MNYLSDSYKSKLLPVKEKLYISRHIKPNDKFKPCAITIGNFDGIHLGHRKILTYLCNEAKTRDLLPSILTFNPHPKEYFSGEKQRSICGLRDKLSLLAQQGIRQVIINRFNTEIAKTSAENFIKDYLINILKVRLVIVGENFRFGYNRSGDINTLREAGLNSCFETISVEMLKDNECYNISSSRIRAILNKGNITKANKLLGRRFSISGHVIHGNKIGRTIGFPTMNLKIQQECAVSAGVYAVIVHGLKGKSLPGVAFLGTRKTLENNGQMLLETYLLDEKVNAYGEIIEVDLIMKLRDEEKFTNISTLIKAIEKDVQNARYYFLKYGLQKNT
ncbi:riboflavin kinase/FMN adenylyltransferase [Candidatus Kinetoplastibacterium blastocrithidii TCC012E]|uniref:Riboflavin biosynthesis protein n=1 Tax=Candidatus Kinetoplastidibacterium blastocrithidiae TCC012E TaxID=1208922 RepID=M1LVT5_9PROT|nr:bifunctional riboflavin kinase/FAD synthetase [Candidatus Kinetoplastibacterium blastocrithidii]AFZ83548.1 riboflavin biosynthesis protein RibF [Candidatus Kinetoplastibacterium blastocrithidii (ex Strigomonas culicis)]AGF49667.1 riboflavin kinase/FMN adenylyltransferase [Candidatus Kinetoplastibacterium blastocrithidii TCC012E]